MKTLGFERVNKYAIGDENSRYTNTIGIFSKISFARMHHEISGLQIKVRRGPDSPSNRIDLLYDTIKEINGYGGAE